MNVPPNENSTIRSLVPLLLALILAAAVISVLSLLTLGFVGVVVAVVSGMAAFIGLQYVVWGWWLGRVIREDFESETSESLPVDTDESHNK